MRNLVTTHCISYISYVTIKLRHSSSLVQMCTGSWVVSKLANTALQNIGQGLSILMWCFFKIYILSWYLLFTFGYFRLNIKATWIKVAIAECKLKFPISFDLSTHISKIKLSPQSIANINRLKSSGGNSLSNLNNEDPSPSNFVPTSRYKTRMFPT